MPDFLEKKLEKSAAKAGKSGKAADRYVYGAMNKMGAMKGNKETPKGRAMEKKHKADMGTKKKGSSRQHGKKMSADMRDKKMLMGAKA